MENPVVGYFMDDEHLLCANCATELPIEGRLGAESVRHRECNLAFACDECHQYLVAQSPRLERVR